jgi:hypothetical protein
VKHSADRPLATSEAASDRHFMGASNISVPLSSLPKCSFGYPDFVWRRHAQGRASQVSRLTSFGRWLAPRYPRLAFSTTARPMQEGFRSIPTDLVALSAAGRLRTTCLGKPAGVHLHVKQVQHHAGAAIGLPLLSRVGAW